MLNNPAARKVAAVIIDPPAKLLVRMKVSPDAGTLTGTIGARSATSTPRGTGFVWSSSLRTVDDHARMKGRTVENWTQPSIGSPTVPSSRHWCCGE